MANLLAGTIQVDWKLLNKALKALGIEGVAIQYAIPVRGGIEIGTLDGVKTWKPPRTRKKRTSTAPKGSASSESVSKP